MDMTENKQQSSSDDDKRLWLRSDMVPKGRGTGKNTHALTPAHARPHTHATISLSVSEMIAKLERT